MRSLLDEFIAAVNEISEAVNSDQWRGEDVMGIFFNEFNRYKKKSESGQVFTPDHITDFMYKLIGVSQNDRVLDACCGSGAFLVKSMGNMLDEAGGRGTAKAKAIMAEQLYGIEFDREVYALACANMLIHKDGKTNLRLDDARSIDAGDWIAEQNITKVLMNPPYEPKYGPLKIVRNVLDNVPAGTQAAFLLPDTKLEKMPSDTKKILAKHRLTKVIKMPENLFFGVGVTTSIFVFTAGVPQDGQEYFACYFDDDGLETVKNSGRHDVRGKWASIEAEWLKVVTRMSGHDTIQWNDPADNLSWVKPREPFSITREDFIRTALNYQAFTQGFDVTEMRERIADAVLLDPDMSLMKGGELISAKEVSDARA